MADAKRGLAETFLEESCAALFRGDVRGLDDTWFGDWEQVFTGDPKKAPSRAVYWDAGTGRLYALPFDRDCPRLFLLFVNFSLAFPDVDARAAYLKRHAEDLLSGKYPAFTARAERAAMDRLGGAR
jgi:hypothetical protein